MSSTDIDPRWRAVLAREPGTFVYAVTTTGVYCLPTCPARRPRPENVAFYPDAAAAARAGFRACRRCRPDAVGSPPTAAGARVASLCRMIEARDATPSLSALARHVGLSAPYTQRLFKRVTGLTPREYGQACRSARMRAALARGEGVTAAMHAAGYGSSSRLYETAQARLGMEPGRLRRGGEGVEIRFAVGECSLGAVLVAATAKGICAISLGDAPEPLVEELERSFAGAELVAGDAAFGRHVAAVVALVDDPRVGVELPLDIRGTAFQERVWRALRAVPPGERVSYGELAARIGAPRATRAVASACAQNRIAVAIPCHRIVRRDGGLSGYRWGVERKRALLEREAPGGS